MRKVNTYLIDGNQSNLELLKKSLTDLGVQVLGTALKSSDVINDYKKFSPDVIITDVNLGGNLGGIDFVKSMRSGNWKNSQVIFLTSETNIEIFHKAEEIEPAAYLIKPLNIYNIYYALEMSLKNCEQKIIDREKTSSNLQQNNEEIFHIKKMRKIVKVPVSEISYIMVESNYSTLTTRLGKFTLKLSLKDLMQKLPNKMFLRIHRNYMVNINQIEEYDFSEYTAKLSNKSLPIGRRYKSTITKRLTLLS
ncbi:MAG: hypothetical protein A2068_11675 [Ignavibacteria bacterium GWB2_35_6b]|nr:MAG: hypothetical protein A2068_11675 [Ignavibacteria bacterium GWB2_35_6b]